MSEIDDVNTQGGPGGGSEGDVGHADESILDKLRGSPVGVNDPTVVGDAGPTDQPPGSDGDALVVDGPVVDEPFVGGGGDPGPKTTE